MILVLFRLKRTFIGYSEEHRLIKLNEFISLSEGKTFSGSFPIDWTKIFERNKIPHRKKGCFYCDNTKFCSNCVKGPKLNYFDCEV